MQLDRQSDACGERETEGRSGKELGRQDARKKGLSQASFTSSRKKLSEIHENLRELQQKFTNFENTLKQIKINGAGPFTSLTTPSIPNPFPLCNPNPMSSQQENPKIPKRPRIQKLQNSENSTKQKIRIDNKIYECKNIPNSYFQNVEVLFRSQMERSKTAGRNRKMRKVPRKSQQEHQPLEVLFCKEKQPSTNAAKLPNPKQEQPKKNVIIQNLHFINSSLTPQKNENPSSLFSQARTKQLQQCKRMMNNNKRTNRYCNCCSHREDSASGSPSPSPCHAEREYRINNRVRYTKTSESNRRRDRELCENEDVSKFQSEEGDLMENTHEYFSKTPNQDHTQAQIQSHNRQDSARTNKKKFNQVENFSHTAQETFKWNGIKFREKPAVTDRFENSPKEKMTSPGLRRAQTSKFRKKAEQTERKPIEITNEPTKPIQQEPQQTKTRSHSTANTQLHSIHPQPQPQKPSKIPQEPLITFQNESPTKEPPQVLHYEHEDTGSHTYQIKITGRIGPATLGREKKYAVNGINGREDRLYRIEEMLREEVSCQVSGRLSSNRKGEELEETKGLAEEGKLEERKPQMQAELKLETASRMVKEPEKGPEVFKQEAKEVKTTQEQPKRDELKPPERNESETEKEPQPIVKTEEISPYLEMKPQLKESEKDPEPEPERQIEPILLPEIPPQMEAELQNQPQIEIEMVIQLERELEKEIIQASLQQQAQIEQPIADLNERPEKELQSGEKECVQAWMEAEIAQIQKEEIQLEPFIQLQTEQGQAKHDSAQPSTPIKQESIQKQVQKGKGPAEEELNHGQPEPLPIPQPHLQTQTSAVQLEMEQQKTEQSMLISFSKKSFHLQRKSSQIESSYLPSQLPEVQQMKKIQSQNLETKIKAIKMKPKEKSIKKHENKRTKFTQSTIKRENTQQKKKQAPKQQEQEPKSKQPVQNVSNRPSHIRKPSSFLPQPKPQAKPRQADPESPHILSEVSSISIDVHGVKSRNVSIDQSMPKSNLKCQESYSLFSAGSAQRSSLLADLPKEEKLEMNQDKKEKMEESSKLMGYTDSQLLIANPPQRNSRNEADDTCHFLSESSSIKQYGQESICQKLHNFQHPHPQTSLQNIQKQPQMKRKIIKNIETDKRVQRLDTVIQVVEEKVRKVEKVGVDMGIQWVERLSLLSEDSQKKIAVQSRVEILLGENQDPQPKMKEEIIPQAIKIEQKDQANIIKEDNQCKILSSEQTKEEFNSSERDQIVESIKLPQQGRKLLNQNTQTSMFWKPFDRSRLRLCSQTVSLAEKASLIKMHHMFSLCVHSDPLPSQKQSILPAVPVSNVEPQERKEPLTIPKLELEQKRVDEEVQPEENDVKQQKIEQQVFEQPVKISMKSSVSTNRHIKFQNPQPLIVPLIRIRSQTLKCKPEHFSIKKDHLLHIEAVKMHQAITAEIFKKVNQDYEQFRDRLFTPGKKGQLWLWKEQFKLYQAQLKPCYTAQQYLDSLFLTLHKAQPQGLSDFRTYLQALTGSPLLRLQNSKWNKVKTIKKNPHICGFALSDQQEVHRIVGAEEIKGEDKGQGRLRFVKLRKGNGKTVNIGWEKFLEVYQYPFLTCINKQYYLRSAKIMPIDTKSNYKPQFFILDINFSSVNSALTSSRASKTHCLISLEPQTTHQTFLTIYQQVEPNKFLNIGTGDASFLSVNLKKQSYMFVFENCQGHDGVINLCSNIEVEVTNGRWAQDTTDVICSKGEQLRKCQELE